MAWNMRTKKLKHCVETVFHNACLALSCIRLSQFVTGGHKSFVFYSGQKIFASVISFAPILFTFMWTFNPR